MGHRRPPVNVWDFLLQVIDRQDYTDRLIAIGWVLLWMVGVVAVILVVLLSAPWTLPVGGGAIILGLARHVLRRRERRS